MSTASQVANNAAQLDWKLIAAAAATFIATLVIAIGGWMQGKRKLSERLDRATNDGSVTSTVLLDNLTIREATLVNREVRDRLLLHSEALHATCKATDNNTSSMDDLIQEMKDLRRSIDNLPHRP